MVTLDKKPSAARQEPRSYVRPVPLPIPAQKGVRIQARSQEVYSATVPSRDEVRKDNYLRRSDQLERQGFNAYNYRPYKGIGDPFYLDEKKLILHALGQWNENDDDSDFSSSDDESIYLDSRPKKVQIPRKYVYKVRREKSRLAKEIKNGREMMRNVRLGHGFFNIIDQQRQQRMREQAAHEAEERDRRQRAVQAAGESSSSDDEHDFMADAVTISCPHSTPLPPTPTPTPSGRSPRSSRPQTGKKRPPSRPYTPLHSSLLADEPDTSAKGSLFRQLCILHWLLESMSTDNASMAPIMTSWNLREMGGQKVTSRKAQMERTTETAWTNFQQTPVSIYPPQPTTKRASTVMFNVLQVSKRWGGMRKGGASRKVSGLGPRGSIDSTAGGRPHSAKSGSETSDRESEVDDEIINKNLFSFLDEYYMSLRKEQEQQNPTATSEADDVTKEADKMAAESGEKKRHHHHHHRERRTDEERALRKARRTPDTARESQAEQQMMSYRAQSAGSIRPRSSPALVEFTQSAMSNRYSSLSRDMSRDFSLVDQEKNLDLKESIQYLEKARLKNCRTKFTNLSTVYSTSDKALRQMRGSLSDGRREELNRQLSDISPWFNDLVSRLPREVRDIWYFNAILDKLSTYVENGKANSSKFQKTLSTLREWEICSPDVAAAVEFCREKIIEMSVEDFEKWFKEHFPNVERPSPIMLQVDQATRSTSQASRSTRPKTTGSIRSRCT